MIYLQILGGRGKIHFILPPSYTTCKYWRGKMGKMFLHFGGFFFKKTNILAGNALVIILKIKTTITFFRPNSPYFHYIQLTHAPTFFLLNHNSFFQLISNDQCKYWLHPDTQSSKHQRSEIINILKSSLRLKSTTNPN